MMSFKEAISVMSESYNKKTGMNRQKRLVAMQACYEAHAAFPEGMATRDLFLRLYEDMLAELEPVKGEVDEAMGEVAIALDGKKRNDSKVHRAKPEIS